MSSAGAIPTRLRGALILVAGGSTQNPAQVGCLISRGRPRGAGLSLGPRWCRVLGPQ